MKQKNRARAPRAREKNAATDLALQQELSMAVMNLVAVEEHLAMTLAKAPRPAYLDLYEGVRALRARHMRALVKNRDGENWCAAKHLLASCMHFLETGVKYGALGKKKQAFACFRDAMEAYTAFWFLQEALP